MKKEIKEKIIEILRAEWRIPQKIEEELADQILELFAQVKEELLERIKLKEETKLFDEDEWSEGYKGGYNQAIADLEKLKEALKKNYIIARLKDEK